ncbi:hypothetical protein FVEG_14965 [Fusarium verticillioides 7600]|uniref:Uncharacterized protein n=1 Tax=Gibberella moniliformis (strain M3125 / FGSC 7600) TaxID=334819 RepID=W7M219_GIBM7|nr:hypothetical protein FVEG_14965 [Fusarium verticillioides 7600]EWG38937.1 hypothetical protein FVEG_14965 [Fusarium verticillioides 7600]
MNESLPSSPFIHGDGWIHPSTYPFGFASTYHWLGEIKVKVIPVRKAFSRLQLDCLPQLLISPIFLKVDRSYRTRFKATASQSSVRCMYYFRQSRDPHHARFWWSSMLQGDN